MEKSVNPLFTEKADNLVSKRPVYSPNLRRLTGPAIVQAGPFFQKLIMQERRESACPNPICMVVNPDQRSPTDAERRVLNIPADATLMSVWSAAACT